MSKLTEKQKRFADFYIETGNATEAARKAGYKGNSLNRIAFENLSKLDIKKYIDLRLKELDDERIATAEEVMGYLTSVMRGDIEEECIVVEGEGDGCSSARRISKQVSPKDRNKAAELLAKRFGLLVENMNITGEIVQIIDDVPKNSDRK